jgi:NAD(P)-dependent dehydrogenase (short-subunit alcohol dehydrogenase family)
VFRALAEHVVARGGTASMVAISSGYVSGDPIRANYRAAKAGVVALMKSVALAGETSGFRCNCIAPGANTRMTEAASLVMDGEPEDVAPMAVYLLSDASSTINGRIFTVIGDRIASWRDPVEDRMIHAAGQWTQEDLADQVPWLLSETTTARPPT